MGTLGSSEQIICQTTRCKIPEENSSYNNKHLAFIVQKSVLLNKYYQFHQINEVGELCSMYERQEMCLQGFGFDTYGKEPLGRPRFMWQDNIKNGSSRCDMGRHGLGYSG
jgi:hypothetical protein